MKLAEHLDGILLHRILVNHLQLDPRPSSHPSEASLS